MDQGTSEAVVLSKMDHEDSNSGFELLSSQPDKKEFEKAPEETLFKFKLQDGDGNKARKMSYKLKKDTALPYSTIIGGLNVNEIKNRSNLFCNRCRDFS